MYVAHDQPNSKTDDDRLRGVTAISNFLGTPTTLTKLSLEARLLPGFLIDGDWTADKLDLEPHRAGGGQRLLGGPAGYPRRASFAQ